MPGLPPFHHAQGSSLVFEKGSDGPWSRVAPVDLGMLSVALATGEL